MSWKFSWSLKKMIRSSAKFPSNSMFHTDVLQLEETAQCDWARCFI